MCSNYDGLQYTSNPFDFLTFFLFTPPFVLILSGGAHIEVVSGYAISRNYLFNSILPAILFYFFHFFSKLHS